MSLKPLLLRRFAPAVVATASLALAGLAVPVPAQGVVAPTSSTLARQASADGIVLLRNDDAVLPLDASRKVAVFGRVQLQYFYGGYGSGRLPNAPYKTDLLTGLRGNPSITVDEETAAVYTQYCEEHPVTGSPAFLAEMPVSAQFAEEAAARSDTALVVIGRAAGENNDVNPTNYTLRPPERTMLAQVTAAFDKVAVLVNTGNVIDLTWVNDYDIDSLVIAWQGGQESGPAAADVLSGDVTPSGKLPDTFATSLQDYPAREFFGGTAFTNYAEDIFVGYRYFETFAPQNVLFPFGYGLSYTDFSVVTQSVTESAGQIAVRVRVTNTGTAPGKEVVQVYYGAPTGKLGKAARSLVAYVKTNNLMPGSSETVTLTFDVTDMASYDDAGYTTADGGSKSAWVLEAGDYPVYVGTSVRNAVQEGVHVESATRVTEQLEETLAVYPSASAFERWHAAENQSGEVELVKTGQVTPTRTLDLPARITASLPPDRPYAASGPAASPIKLVDVYNGTATMEQFMAQLTLNELSLMTAGCGPCGMAGVSGGTSVYGAVTQTLLNTYGVPDMATCDGPAGARITATATQIPNGTALAATWNDKLVAQLFESIGQEVLINGSSVLLAPGMNIHRDPLGGRNFEYFSEDPLLTGQMGSAAVRGLQSQGVSATPKHFAANSQETSRRTNDSRVSERALREIYMKGFEIVVKGAKPQNIMASYNLVNSIQAHENYQLITMVLREQWGYDGVVMTDWNSTLTADPDFPGITANSYRVRAGTDVLKPGGQKAEGDPEAAVRAGALHVGEVQAAVERVLNFALKSSRFRQVNSLPLFDYTPGTPAFAVDQPEPTPSPAEMIYLNGQAMRGFDPAVLNYTMYLPAGTDYPTITASVPGTVSASIVQPSAARPRGDVTVSSPDGSASRYLIAFSSESGIPLPGVPVTNARLTSIEINGTPMVEFNPERFDYSTFVADPAAADVTGTAGPNVDVFVTRDGNLVTLTVQSPSEKKRYTVALEGPQVEFPHSDEFDGTTLKDFWTVDNQTSSLSAATAGVLNITGEPGDWLRTATGMKNVVWQHSPGNWTAVVKLTPDVLPTTRFQQVGLQVFQDEDNYAHLAWKWGTERRWGLVVEANGTDTQTNSTSAIPTAVGPLALRVDKRGGEYTFYTARADVNSVLFRWQQIGSVVQTAWTEPKIALVASLGSLASYSNIPITASYDYIRFFAENTLPGQLPVSDDFDTAALDTSVWTVQNQTAQLSTPAGSVQIVTEDGEWYRGRTTQKNVVAQPVPGDWQATTKVEWNDRPYTNSQQAGVMVYDDRDNFVQFFIECGSNPTVCRFAVKQEIAGANNGVGTNVSKPALIPPTGPGYALFRVIKQGAAYRFAASIDDGRTWVYINPTPTGELVLPFANPRFGLIALSPGTAPSFTVNYDYVHFEPVTPPVATIHTNGISMVKGWEQATYATPGLVPEVGNNNAGEPTVAGSHVGKTAVGERTYYTIDVATAGYYVMGPRFSTNAAGSVARIGVWLDGELLATLERAGNTGGWQVFADGEPTVVYLPAGRHALAVSYESSAFNFNYLQFVMADPVIDRSGLAAQIEAAKALDPAAYTTSTWEGVQVALMVGQSALASPWVTPQHIADSEARLVAAIGELEPFTAPALVALSTPTVTFSTGQASYPATAVAAIGSWNANPRSIALAWLRDGDPIPGATGPSYELTLDDIGTRLAVQVTASSIGRPDAIALSVPATIRGGAAPELVVAPAISGTARVGEALTVSAAQFNPAPATVSYQWLADGTPIPGATTDTYTPVPSDVGAMVSVQVTATTPGIQDARVTTSGFGPITRGGPNVAALTSALAQATALVEANYTTSSWPALAAAVQAGQDVVDAVEATGTAVTQYEVDSATATLTLAISQLVLRGQVGALSDLVDMLDALGLDPLIYTDASWEDFADAWDAAAGLVADPSDATQADVDGAAVDLVEKYSALEPLAAGNVTEQLEQLLDAVASLDLVSEEFTPDSWAAFLVARDDARTVLATLPPPRPDLVAEAVEHLQDALSQLAPRSDVDTLAGVILAIEQLGLRAADYTDASWVAYQSALTQAHAMVFAGRDAVPQADIDAAQAALAAALRGLRTPASSGRLVAILTGVEALTLDPDLYTPSSWTAWRAAITNGLQISEDPTATQGQIDQAASRIVNAAGGLRQRVPTGELAGAIRLADALNLDPTGFTAESWARFQAAKTSAVTIMAIPNASNSQITGALAALDAAITGLVPLPSTAALEMLYQASQGFVGADYTPDSWLALVTARTAAGAALSGPATTAELEQAVGALRGAIVGLVPVVSKANLLATLGVIDALNLDPADYTAATWRTFREALAAARLALSSGSSQVGVDQALETLRQASAGLTKHPGDDPTTNPTEQPDPGDDGDTPGGGDGGTPGGEDNGTPGGEGGGGGSTTPPPGGSGGDTPGGGGTTPPPSTPAPSPTAGPNDTGQAPQTAPSTVLKVLVAQSTLRLKAGASIRLAGFGYTADGKQVAAKWSSSKPSVAKVSANGKIRAVATGKATLRVKAGGKSATVKVVVVAKRTTSKAVTKVRAVGLPKTMTVGQVRDIKGRWAPSSATGVKVTFTSSKPGVLSVSKAGRLSALAKGKATVTVKAAGKTARYSVTVR